MKVRIFVSGSAAVFAGWLGLTFVREVLRESYPELGRGPLTASVESDVAEVEVIPEEIAAESAIAMD